MAANAKLLLAVAILGAAACLAAADEAAPAFYGGGYGGGGSYGKGGFVLYEVGTPFTVPATDNGVTAGQTAVYTIDVSYTKGGPVAGTMAWTGVYISNAQGTDARVNWQATIRLSSVQGKWGKTSGPATIIAAGVSGGVQNTARATYPITGATGIKVKDGSVTYESGAYTVSLY